LELAQVVEVGYEREANRPRATSRPTLKGERSRTAWAAAVALA
jgi:hypothetical protein